MIDREDREDVLEALQYIDPDIYENWFIVATALKTMGFPVETFKQWASRSPKYNERENERKWNRDIRESGNPDKEANILKKMGRENGWHPDREKSARSYSQKRDTARKGPGRPVNEQTGKEGQEPMEDEKNAPGAADGEKMNFSDIIAKAYRDREKTDYWKSRGLNEATIDAFQLGYKENQTFFDKETKKPFTAPGVIIPYPDRDYYIARSIDGKYFYKPNKNTAGPEPLFLGDYLAESAPCFIVESQIDALSIYQAGGLAAAIGGAGKGKLLDAVKKDRPPQPLILSLDNDPEGESMGKTLAEDLDNLKIPYIFADWTLDEYPKDKPRKDANDFLRSNPGQFAADIKSNMKKARKLPLFEEGQKKFSDYVERIFKNSYDLIPSGLPAVDDLLMGGFLPGTMVIIGGPPGSGKTALATMIAESMASKGRRFLYLNLEMSRDQMYSRSLSRLAFTAPDGQARTLTALDVLQAYKASPEDQTAIKRAAATYKARIAPNLCYNPDWTATGAAGILDKLAEVALDSKREGKQPPDICLDYLQLVTGSGRADQPEILKEILTGLKRYAITNNAIVIGLTAQSRRANMSDEPAQESGRDSSNLEYSADIQLQLIPDRNGKAEADGAQFNKVYLHITKSRFTPASTNKEDGKEFYFFGGQNYLMDPEKESARKAP